VGEPQATGGAAPNQAFKEAGTVVGKYTLLARVASGGMGEIFVARQSGAGGFEKQVVIKRLLPHLAEDVNFVAMLLDEARIAARLSHPNVCQVHELGEADGNYYIAMEHLEGVPASMMLRRARKAGEVVPLPIAAAILRQACDGLHHAHELTDGDGKPIGLVHRDVSPSNLFVTVPGAVKLLDFGVAKSKDALARTHTGALKGKYAYMSPEQVLGKEVDRRSDLFALGTVYFELLTCRRLFWRDSEYQMFQAIVEDPLPPVTAYRADVPPEVAAILGRALSRDPAERFATAAELGAAVEAAMARHGGLASNRELADYLGQGFADDLAAARQMVHDGAALAARAATAPRGRPRPVSMGDSLEIVIGEGELRALTSRRSRGAGGRVLAVIGALAVLAAGGVALWQMNQRPAATASEPVVVRSGAVVVERPDGTTRAVGEPAGTEPAAAIAPVAAIDAGAASAPPAGGAGPIERPGGQGKPARSTDPYRAALGGRQKQIAACFQQHAVSVSGGAPSVAMAFDIDARGKPTRVAVEPAAVASTPLGTCLVEVARGVEFPATGQAVGVTIPLRLRKK
jgi:hypothetical protein